VPIFIVYRRGTCAIERLGDARFPDIWADLTTDEAYRGKRDEKFGNLTVEVYVWETKLNVSTRANT